MKRTVQMTIGLLLSAMLLAGCGFPTPKGRSAAAQLNPPGTQHVRGRQDGNDGLYFWHLFDNDNNEGNVGYFNTGTQGSYSVGWSYTPPANGGSPWVMVAGKGWSTGTQNRIVEYEGDFNPAVSEYDDGTSDFQNAYLSVYGWARTSSELIEYYVLESYGEYYQGKPAEGAPEYTLEGEPYSSQGSEYQIYSLQKTDANIDGYGPFRQLISVRKNREGIGSVRGRVLFSDHVSAWQRAGYTFTSSYDYQILATEANNSNGNANMTLHEGAADDDDVLSPWIVDIGAIMDQLNGSKFWGGTVMLSNGDHRGTITQDSINFAQVTRNVGGVTKSYSIGNLAASVEFSGITPDPSARYVPVHVKIEQVQIANSTGPDSITADDIVDKKYFPHPEDYYDFVPSGLTRQEAISWMAENGYGSWISSMEVVAVNYNASEHTAITFDGEATIDTLMNEINIEGASINGVGLVDYTIRFVNEEGKPVLVAYYTCPGDQFNSGRLALDLTNEGSSVILPYIAGGAGNFFRVETQPPIIVTSSVRFQNLWTGRVLTLSNETEYGDRLLKAQPYHGEWNTQQWAVEDVGDGTDAVRLRNLNDNEYLTIRSNGNNASVITQPLNESWASQKWYLSNAGGGKVRLITQWTPHKALNVGEQNDYAAVVSYCINNSWNSQKWTVIEE